MSLDLYHNYLHILPESVLGTNAELDTTGFVTIFMIIVLIIFMIPGLLDFVKMFKICVEVMIYASIISALIIILYYTTDTSENFWRMVDYQEDNREDDQEDDMAHAKAYIKYLFYLIKTNKVAYLENQKADQKNIVKKGSHIYQICD